MRVATGNKAREAAVDGAVFTVAERNSIAVRTVRREAGRCLRCDLEDAE